MTVLERFDLILFVFFHLGKHCDSWNDLIYFLFICLFML